MYFTTAIRSKSLIFWCLAAQVPHLLSAADAAAING
jgi:hypothetical protein